MLKQNKPFDLDDHRYLVEIYRDNSREIVLCKAGQVGVSEYLISYVFWAADTRRCNGLYVFPTETHVGDFSAARVGPAIEPLVSPHLAEITHEGQKEKVDKVGLKRIGDAYIYFRGAAVKIDGKAPQLRSIDADVLVLDEYDEMPRNAPALARERLGHSKYAEVRVVSTPSYQQQGIYPLYLKTTMNTWFVKCPSCSNQQDLTIDDLVIEWDELKRPAAWHKTKNGRPFLACRKCSEKLDHLAPGEWVKKYPGRDITGYHLSRLFMPHRTLKELLEKLSRTEEYERKEAWNQGLGLPFRSTGALSLTPQILDACRRNYRFRPPKGNKIFAGIDVGNVLHIVIREKNSRGNSVLCFAGQVAEFNEAAYLLKTFNVNVCVVDALPETRSARNFRKMLPDGVVWLAYYTSIDKHDMSEQWNLAEGTVNADRTRTLDTTFAGFFDASQGKIGNTLPMNVVNVVDYYRQMTNIERVVEQRQSGNMVAMYVGGADDHFAHAENYANIASRCIMIQTWYKTPSS